MTDLKKPLTRRRVVQLGAGAVGLGLGAVALGPAMATLLHPLHKTTTTGPDGFLPAGHISRFGDGVPVKVSLSGGRTDAWNRIALIQVGAAWVRRERGELVALSTVCPHLGCSVGFDPVRNKYTCPCHVSAFSLGGEVEFGPAPRSLDQLETRVENDLVQVRFRRFKLNVAEKTAL